MQILLIGLGGFVGALARYLIDGWVTRLSGEGFPWGTLAINASGSFAIGVLFAASVERATLPAELRGPVMIGFIGAYTTFSTYMLESWRLLEDGSFGLAALNLGGSVILGLAAIMVGLAVGRAI
ncbi:MAG TPA: fluoride efflux transporter CrcB [Candidatus Limnocylindria bacterium]|nr:fluoride efflux transporter CrcB [Candidatus Limnocylindria bacterium]